MTDKNDLRQESNLTKEERKALKEQKKKEKLAKLEAKKQVQQQTTSKKNVTVNKKTKGYDPTPVEAKWNEYWLKNKTFEVGTEHKNNFCMVIPPPNITGSLHIGHAMMVAIEDTIVRYKRQNKHNVLYLPGLDHAGIATQSVVMKKLAREEPGKVVTREHFLDTAHEWAKTYGNRIIDQFYRLGTSLDFSKQMFTLDPKVSNSVSSAFVELYKKGLIYRENKIVNWSGKLKTTLSDLEVNYKEIKGGEMVEVDGKKYKMAMMYYIKYHLLRGCDVEQYTSEIEKVKKQFKFEEGLDEAINERIYSKLPYVIVGTTRPETILGDTALCINPKDERFFNIENIFESGKVEDVFNAKNRKEEAKTGDEKEEMDINAQLKQEKKNKFKGKNSINEEETKTVDLFVINPLTYEIIKVICDEHADLTLGTGMLKVTPAHDPIDFALGKKHNLEFKQVIDLENKISHEYYKNMNRFECREKIKQHACMVKMEERTQILPFCSRSNDIVESILKAQWWMNCDRMAERSCEAVRTGDIKLVPEEAKAVWFRWLENIKDWCLSRQLWWGHRIPAYKYVKEGEEIWIVAESKKEAESEVLKKEGKMYELVQDEDVLDTWFSSGLWPFSTLGWKWGSEGCLCNKGKSVEDKLKNLCVCENCKCNQEDLLKQFFPNSMLETGSDILFFWVARMVMLSFTLLDKKPFDTILLHGIVRDAHGRKMSKSLGNVIDPIFVIEGITQEQLIENISVNVSPSEMERAKQSTKLDYPQGIPKCGADALRFALLSYTNKMKDINLDILRVAGYSRLCNKIYNAYKFVEIKTGSLENLEEIENGAWLKNAKISEQSKFILECLNTCIDEQHMYFEAYNFMNVTQSLHKFILYNFCDVYIESMKDANELDDLKTLRYVFISFLKLLNPTMPFISQELYSKMHKNENKLISDYPEKTSRDLTNKFVFDKKQ